MGKTIIPKTVLALKVGSIFCLLMLFIGIAFGGAGNSVPIVLGTAQVKSEADSLCFSE